MARMIEDGAGQWYIDRAETGKPEDWILGGDGEPKMMTESECRDRLHQGDYADDPQDAAAAPAKAERKGRRK